MFKSTPLLSEESIQNRVREIADSLNRDYAGRTVDALCVLKGSMFFAADLFRNLTVPVRVHFMQVSSYGSSTESSGTVNLYFSSAFEVEDCDVLLVEDILDTGITMNYLLERLRARNPRTMKTCVLLDKPARRKLDIKADYVGFEIQDHFVVGYGLDYNELGRNMRHIAIIDPAAHEE